MSTFNLLQSGLILHITGITMMAGLTLANFVSFFQVWKFLPQDRDKAMLVIKATKRFPLLMVIGGGLILVGGISMMVAVHGVFMHQAWFKIKLFLLLTLIVNALVLARPANKGLRKILKGDQPEGNSFEGMVVLVKKKVMLFHVLQLVVFLLIFVLSVLRFG